MNHGQAMTETCTVADSQCVMPANQPEPIRSPRTRCVQCGERVCVSCSIKAEGRRCGNCIEENAKDGPLYEPVLWRYLNHQVVIAGWDTGEGIGRETINGWFRARAKELGLPSEDVQE